MSNVNAELLKHILEEFKAADGSQAEDGGVELYLEDDKGNEQLLSSSDSGKPKPTVCRVWKVSRYQAASLLR